MVSGLAFAQTNCHTRPVQESKMNCQREALGETPYAKRPFPRQNSGSSCLSIPAVSADQLGPSCQLSSNRQIAGAIDLRFMLITDCFLNSLSIDGVGLAQSRKTIQMIRKKRPTAAHSSSSKTRSTSIARYGPGPGGFQIGQ